MTARHVVVIGGGLAGLTAAITLREAGTAVTLLEARPRLGGATTSFTRAGLEIDTGQHVFLRCCTAYRELIARLGMTGSVTLQDRFDITVLSPAGRARLRRSRLPAPLHLTGALARYSLLPPADRLRAARAVAALRLAGPSRLAPDASPPWPGSGQAAALTARPAPPARSGSRLSALDSVRLGDWLAAHGQREQARRRLWDLFVVSSLNIAGDDASTELAATVIRTGLLERSDAADIGVPAVPLGRLHGEPAMDLLGRLGADVRLGSKVTSLQPAAGGAGFAVRAAGEVLTADGVVLAVPAWTAARLAPPPAVGGWARLEPSPIVNVHVIYDRRVTRLPMAAAVDSPVQWVFDKTRQAGLASGQYLAVSVSAADEYVDTPAAQLREQFLPALAQLYPAARQARVRDFFVTRERRATFRQGPGCGALRPGPTTPVGGLVLAGAWTDTGWPDTMEGAVRSGLNAARQMQHEIAGREPAAGCGRAGRPAAQAPVRAAGAAS